MRCVWKNLVFVAAPTDIFKDRHYICNMAISNILVAIDGSPNSIRALKMAIQIAKPANAKMTMVHAIYEQSNTEFRAADADVPERDEIHHMIQDAEKIVQESGIPFATKIVSGNTGYHIVKMAHGSPKFDLVVLGSRGRGSIKEMFFGSTSNYVIHSSKIPVLVVK